MRYSSSSINERSELMNDHYNLDRFIGAQAKAYASVLEELRAGKKYGHWMWYIFPQIKGLGHSAMAEQYAIASLEEANEYLKHPLLGSRLRECAGVVMSLEGRPAEQIFHYPDNLKFRSSMTLFTEAAGRDSIFQDVLRKYFEGDADQLTLHILRIPDCRK